MDWFVRAFLKSSLAWLAAGVTLGVAMAAHPAWALYRPAHLHMNVLGFVSMMIFGVAYHVIPRFSGHPLHAPKLAGAHVWISNAGLALLSAGFALRVTLGTSQTLAAAVLSTGGVLSALGAYLFVYNLWRTIDGNSAAKAAAARAGMHPIARRA